LARAEIAAIAAISSDPRFNRAIDDYRAALRLDPNHKASREALNRLGASD
jgi:hypothetical protein